MKHLLITSILLLSSCFTFAESNLNAEQVIRKTLATSKGFIDSHEELKMTITKKSGQQVERVMKSKSLEIENDGNKVVMIFQDPVDVKGSAVLTHSHIKGNDDQWIYLPALRRVKRISSANKSGPFMGSDFAFEDLSSFEFEKYTYKLLGKESLNGIEHYKIERIPAYEGSGYSKQNVWIDTKNFLVHKVEMFDTASKLYKTQILSDYKNHFDNYWRANKISINNHQNGNSTTLKWSGNIVFNNGFSERDFSKSALKR